MNQLRSRVDKLPFSWLLGGSGRSFHLTGQNLNASWSWESSSRLLVYSTSVAVLSLAMVLCPSLWILACICLIWSPWFMGTPKQIFRVYPLQSSLLSSAYIPTTTGVPNSDFYLLSSASPVGHKVRATEGFITFIYLLSWMLVLFRICKQFLPV